MDELNLIYTDILMEHANSIYNKRKLDEYDFQEKGHNPSCGDEISLEIKFDREMIKDIAFQGVGCAISQASTSIMIDLLKGKTKQEALELLNIFFRMIKKESMTEAEIEKLEEAQILKGIADMPARVKCAELAWYTMKKILEK